MLTPEEKQEKLNELSKEKEEVITKLNMLPFTSDTNATKARRSACEFKLKEIEFQIARFSLPRVYLPD